MIENVELVNFISHKDTSIQLENGVNVFIGANGAGKSSVIDAITYALYGEHTRDVSRIFLRRGQPKGLYQSSSVSAAGNTLPKGSSDRAENSRQRPSESSPLTRGSLWQERGDNMRNRCPERSPRYSVLTMRR